MYVPGRRVISPGGHTTDRFIDGCPACGRCCIPALMRMRLLLRGLPVRVAAIHRFGILPACPDPERAGLKKQQAAGRRRTVADPAPTTGFLSENEAGCGQKEQ